MVSERHSPVPPAPVPRPWRPAHPLIETCNLPPMPEGLTVHAGAVVGHYVRLHRCVQE